MLKIKIDTTNNEMVIPVAFYDAKGNLVCNVPEIAKSSHDAAAFSKVDSATLLKFSEGYAAYEDKYTKLVGFIDKTGKIVIPARFKSYAVKFQNGVAGVRLPNDDEHLSYIDAKGNILFSILSTDPWPNSNVNGLFVNTYYSNEGRTDVFKVSVNDIKGNQVFSYVATQKTDGSYSYNYVFGSGAIVPSKNINFIGIDQYYRTVIMRNTDNHYGIYDLNGEEILPTVYDYIQAIGTNDDRFVVIKDRKLSIIQILAPVAVISNQIIYINQTASNLKAYSIAGYNYVKLSDLASAFANTNASFDFSFDAVRNEETILYGKTAKQESYTLTQPTAAPKATIAFISANGKVQPLYAYNIEGTNYYRLKDLGLILNFSVIYDGSLNDVHLGG